jgi:hypothetical protein
VTEQTYATHRHRPTLWFVALLCSTLGLMVTLIFILRQPSVLTVGWSLVALGGFLAVYMLRQYALRLQNRIIRLEMQLRLARLGREADLARLSMPQIVALRFASDAELPALVDRTLAEELTGDQIKRAVTTWQGDYLRT